MERTLNRKERRMKKHKYYGDPDRKKKLRALSLNGKPRLIINYDNPFRIPRSKRTQE
jgi:hypothetical protein